MSRPWPENPPLLIVRSAVFNVVFYATLIIMMMFGLPTLLFGRAAVQWLSGLWGRISLFLLRAICGMTIEFRGRDNIPAGGCIVAAKHQSFLEIIALIAIFPAFTFVLKRELTLIPFFGWYIQRCDQIAIDRARGRAALTQVTSKAAHVLADGRPLFIFPEGTRRPPGAEPHYKFGVAFVYAGSNVPCVPLALNSGLFWPRRSFIRRPGTVVLEFLPPLEPGIERTVFFERLQARIETASQRLLEEAATAQPELRRELPVSAASS